MSLGGTPSLVAITHGNVFGSNHSVRYLNQVPYGTAQQRENACLVSKNLHQPVSVIIALRPEENAVFHYIPVPHPRVTNRAMLGLRIHIGVSLRVYGSTADLYTNLDPVIV
jgi:hypothetical protein